MIAAAKTQAVTFDVGGTLIQPWPSVGRVYAEVAAQHGLKNLSPEKLSKNFATAWRAKKNFQHTYGDWADVVDQTFAGLCEPRPSQTFFVEQVWPNFLSKDYGGKHCSDASCHDAGSGRQLVLTPPTSATAPRKMLPWRKPRASGRC